MQNHDPRIVDGEIDDDVFVSPPVLVDDGDEQYVVDVEMRHVLYFLGGVALVGTLIALVWEWSNHRFRMRRQEQLTAAITHGAQALATIMVESRLLIQKIDVSDEDKQ